MKTEEIINNKILKNPIIEKIIKDLSLNKRQIESGYDVFMKIISEQENLENLDFVTKVIIYDENTIVGIQIPNPNLFNLLKRSKYYLLQDISKINPNIKLANLKDKEVLKPNENIFYWYFPKLRKENNRGPLILWLKDFYTNNKSKKYTKGIYIYGDFGLGKTYFLIALTNYFVNDMELTTSYFNVNDLYEYLKRSIDKSTDLTYHVIDTLKNVDCLLIDDIGSEKANSWFLFNVLYPILEYRLKESKTTLFSSIFSINDLKKNWLKNKELDEIKICRLIDKIKSLTKDVHLKGKNIRDI